VLSDPNSIYRLPGFNHHVTKNELIRKSSTRFQTPHEAESYKLTMELNNHTKPFKKPPAPTKTKRTSRPIFGPMTKESVEIKRLLTNTNSTTSAGSSMAVELYVSDLLKRADRNLSPTPGAQTEAETTFDVPLSNLNADGLFRLEADGTDEVWIPSGRMPVRREQFATYPSVSLSRKGLQHVPNGFKNKQPRNWPSKIVDGRVGGVEAMCVARETASHVKTFRGVHPPRSKDASSPKALSRGAIPTRERVYSNLVEEEEENAVNSLQTGEAQSPNKVRLEVPDLLEGSRIGSPSLVSMSASNYTTSQTIASITPRSAKATD